MPSKTTTNIFVQRYIFLDCLAQSLQSNPLFFLSSLKIINMQTGNINVKTENIFPVIKKFLYSDHEIFLRELISNAVDATQKMKTLAAMGKRTAS